MKSVFLLLFLCLSIASFSQTITWNGTHHNITTPHGYGLFGADNPSFFHIYTDRPEFYFNKGLRVAGAFASYNSDLKLNTNATTRMTILNSNGNIGIGTTTPGYMLDVNGTVNASQIRTPSISFSNNNVVSSPTISTMEFNLDGDSDMDLQLAGDFWLNFYTSREKFFFGNPVVFGQPTLSTYFNSVFTLELDRGMVHDPNITFEFSLTDGDLHLASNRPNITFDNPVKFEQSIQAIGSVTTPYVILDNFNQISSPTTSTMEFKLDNDAIMDLQLTGDLWLNFSTEREKFYFDKSVVLGNSTISTYSDPKFTIELDRGQSPDPNISFEYSTGDGNLHISSNRSNIDFDSQVIFNQNIGIGTSAPTQKLSVDGNISAEEIILENVVGADFVFEEDYDLRSLKETEQFIKANKHLPEIPSAAEMAEEGLEIKTMNILLLQKVEELTLHLIRQEKEMQVMRSKMRDQESKIEALENTQNND